ncbi:oligosaccharide repeat unit polymerase [bacterium]|nr:oligosaccharide repeat unit polymerase [candidate division CSSED10-310 bacterium]
MFEILVWSTGFVTVIAMLIAYIRSKDPLHPMMYLGPMFFYIYCYQPAILYYQDFLRPYFPDITRLEYVQLLNFSCCTAFYAGCLMIFKIRKTPTLNPKIVELPAMFRKRMFNLGILLGTISVGAFLYMVQRGGGFASTFDQAKAYISAPSGYIGDAPLLSFPAILMLSLSFQGRRPQLHHVLLILLFASPFLTFGILGGRRGPIFMGIAILFFPWWLVSRRRVSFRALIAGGCVLAIAVMFVWSQRRQLYIGSNFMFNETAFWDKFIPQEVDTGHEFIFSSGQVLNAQYYNSFYWGRRQFVLFFIRPIPRQIWPTKYEDMGFPNFSAGHSSIDNPDDWLESVGWIPLQGAAHGLVADMYIEFGWGAIIACFLIGSAYSYLWIRSLRSGGIWMILFVEATIISLYLPTQSFAAAMYRFLFMSVPTVILWRRIIQNRITKTRYLYPEIQYERQHG